MRPWRRARTASATVLPTVVFSSTARRLRSLWVVTSILTLVLCMQISIHTGVFDPRVGGPGSRPLAARLPRRQQKIKRSQSTPVGDPVVPLTRGRKRHTAPGRLTTEPGTGVHLLVGPFMGDRRLHE